jgi:hypothetical protein
LCSLGAAFGCLSSLDDTEVALCEHFRGDVGFGARGFPSAANRR